MRAVDLLRHTDNDGDQLTAEGIAAAVALAAELDWPYDLLVSSGAQRATQTLASLLAACGVAHRVGVVVDRGYGSALEERWRRAARAAGGGDLDAIAAVDAELVERECARLAGVLAATFDALPEGGRALVVGHSPLHEAAVRGLVGVTVPPLGKGARVRVLRDDDGRYAVA